MQRFSASVARNRVPRSSARALHGFTVCALRGKARAAHEAAHALLTSCPALHSLCVVHYKARLEVTWSLLEPSFLQDFGFRENFLPLRGAEGCEVTVQWTKGWLPMARRAWWMIFEWCGCCSS